MEKGYYADGEDAYDMRLPFPLKEKTYGSMTPLKQVVAVKRTDEAPKASATTAGEGSGGEAKNSEAGGGGGSSGGGEGGAAAVDGGAVGEVTSKMEGLAVDATAAASAGKA